MVYLSNGFIFYGHLLCQNGWFMMEKKQRMDDLRGNVGKTMTFLPPMTGNGKHTTYKKW